MISGITPSSSFVGLDADNILPLPAGLCSFTRITTQPVTIRSVVNSHTVTVNELCQEPHSQWSLTDLEFGTSKQKQRCPVVNHRPKIHQSLAFLSFALFLILHLFLIHLSLPISSPFVPLDCCHCQWTLHFIYPVWCVWCSVVVKSARYTLPWTSI